MGPGPNGYWALAQWVLVPMGPISCQRVQLLMDPGLHESKQFANGSRQVPKGKGPNGSRSHWVQVPMGPGNVTLVLISNLFLRKICLYD